MSDNSNIPQLIENLINENGFTYRQLWDYMDRVFLQLSKMKRGQFILIHKWAKNNPALFIAVVKLYIIEGHNPNIILNDNETKISHA